MAERVPRETPPTPAEAWGAFGVRTPLAERYVAWLAGPGIERGLIGPRETDRLWSRHVLSSAGIAEVVARDSTVCDVGSGAGLPGVPLAITRPDVRVTLVEPLLRRTRFLDELVGDLGLGDQVEVVRGRAESLHGERVFDVVTSRAVAPLGRLLGWSMPLVAPGGSVVAVKGDRAALEVEESESVWRGDLGCSTPEVLDLVSGGDRVRIVRVARDPSAPVSWSTASSAPRSATRPRTPARKRRNSR